MGSVNVKGGHWARQTWVTLNGFTLGFVFVTHVLAADTVATNPPSSTPVTNAATNAVQGSSVAHELNALTREGWIDAQSDRAALMATLRTGLITRANFVMRRTFHDQGLTLTSRGDVDATQPNVWIWNQTRPFPQRYRVSGSTITVERAGAAPEVMDFNGNPQFSHVASLFKGLVSLDVSAIETHFKVDAFMRDPKGNGWIAVLHPTEALLAKAFRHVVLRGNPTLTSIDMLAPDGDATSVTLSPYTPASATPSP